MPHRYLIFGNSGAGKSTLAQALATRHGLAHLDLDPLAWLPANPGQPPERRPLPDALAEIHAFTARERRWVIEGCYADLLGPLLPQADAVRFLNPPVATCQAHCRARPWEPHKYPSPQAQQANLPMLLAWVADYPTRQGPLSLAAHRALFDAFQGDKRELTDPREWHG
ncbi:MAG: shikimate kinase [Myxococcales bacterium]|nr:shikimate kinase [Myxococcales bacterium]